ncbi:hypothetical protein KEM55_003939, partial [Ascosphaera atra]
GRRKPAPASGRPTRRSSRPAWQRCMGIAMSVCLPGRGSGERKSGWRAGRSWRWRRGRSEFVGRRLRRRGRGRRRTPGPS